MMFHYFQEGFYTLCRFEHTEMPCMQGALSPPVKENKGCQGGFLNPNSFRTAITFQCSTVR